MPTRLMLSLLTALVAAFIVAGAAQARSMYVTSTAYSPCSAGSIMANGNSVHTGAVAMNALRLGTHIWVSRSPTGQRQFTVEDRHAPGSTGLDFWVESCWLARTWGRRTVRVSY